MGSHHDGDEIKGSIHLSEKDYIEARKTSKSVSTAGPKPFVKESHTVGHTKMQELIQISDQNVGIDLLVEKTDVMTLNSTHNGLA
jgi:nucleotide-binding universal stress UspA family protein